MSACLAADAERGAAARALQADGKGRHAPVAHSRHYTAGRGRTTRGRRWLSRYTPPDLAGARGFVARFGCRDDVSETLLRGECTGSILSHYADKRAQALRLYDGEDDPAVLAWLDRHVERIDGYIAELAPDAESLAA